MSDVDLRIGLLLADNVSQPLQAEHGDYPEMFTRLFADVGIAPEQWTMIDARGESLPAIDVADAYVITGSRYSVYDDLPWIPRLADFVGQALASGRRVVGVCFGHQLLAHFFGGHVARSSRGWRVGVNVNEIVSPEPWMQPPLSQYATLSSHQDQVQALPPGAWLLARHPECPIGAFQMPEGALAIQGHPEFDKPYAQALMNTRTEALGRRILDHGLASLADPTTSVTVATWLRNFLCADSRSLEHLNERPHE